MKNKITEFWNERICDKLKSNFSKGIIILIIMPILLVIFIWIRESKCPFTIDYNTDQWATILSAILGYIGTSALGLLALRQNDKLNEINEDYRKIDEKYRNLSIAPYLTFLQFDERLVEYASDISNVSGTILYKDAIEVKYEGLEECKANIYVLGRFVNKSTFPITSYSSKAIVSLYNCMNTEYCKENTVYIGSEKDEYFRFIIPINNMNKIANNLSAIIELAITNSLGFSTKCKIEISGEKKDLTIDYRILPFKDINPYKSE